MEKSDLMIRFAFVSKGVQDVIKVIDYEHVGLYHGNLTFNLGFGDFDPVTNAINDDINTINGDVYHVLNTVLNTVPLFFEEYPNYTLMISGSDSGEEFIKLCKIYCGKKCKNDECKNHNRRINVYTRYVNTNYDHLIKSYIFQGGIAGRIEPFEKDKKYDIVFVQKKISFVI